MLIRIMAASLAILGIVRALTIDNQLTLIKNDCYERMAIGERLDPKSVYKSFDLNTVSNCQLACTTEKDICKAFSFGIGPKGNATCELSTEVVKETADLKPIGTVEDSDFDLYIKKLGCKVVLDKPPPFSDSPSTGRPPLNDEYHSKPSPPEENYGKPVRDPYDNQIDYKPKPDGYSGGRPGGGYDDGKPGGGYNGGKPGGGYDGGKPDGGYDGRKPGGGYNSGKPAGGYDDGKPSGGGYISGKPDGGYQDDRPQNGYNYNKPGKRPGYDNVHEDDESGYVQTIVSVANGPNSYLDHHHGLIIGDDNRPPFRPAALQHPYDEKPQRPLNFRPNPDRYDDRPASLVDKIDYGRPSKRPNSGYGDKPVDLFIERPDYGLHGGYDRPDPSTGYRPRPRPPPDNYDDRPSIGGYDERPRPPPNNYDDRPPIGGYDERPRPPSNNYDDRPPIGGYNERPRPPPNNYNDRPPIGGYDERPRPPSPDYERPGGYGNKPLNEGYNDRPPPKYDSRPPRPYGEERPNNFYNDRRPPKPLRPSDYDRPDIDRYDTPRPIGPNRYDDWPPFRPRPDDYPPPYDMRPLPNRYGSFIPHPDEYDRPDPGYYGGRPNYRPNQDGDGYNNRPKPTYPPNNDKYGQKPKPSNEDKYNNRPGKPQDGYNEKEKPRPTYEKPKPSYNTNKTNEDKGYDRPSGGGGRPYRPPFNGGLYRPSPGSIYGQSPGSSYGQSSNNWDRFNYGGVSYTPGSIVSENVGYHGQRITSIITELGDACFRRALAGKRVSRAFVKRALTCESVEECHRECAEEKRFICEGFNYRLDARGRGKGDCELLDLPISRLDIGRDVYPDPDYDYYERDRNAAVINCRQYRPGYYGDRVGGGGGGGAGGGGYYSYGGGGGGGTSYYQSYGDRNRYDDWDRRHDYGGGLRRPGERWPDDYKYGHRQPRPEYDDDYRPSGNRRGDFSYHNSHHSHHQQNYENSHSYHYYSSDSDRDSHYSGGITYLPATTHFHRPHYDTYQSPNRYQRPNQYLPLPDGNRDYWGLSNQWGSYGGTYGYDYHQNHNNNRYDFDRKNYYLPPPKRDKPKDWGQYGGTYGNGPYLQYNGYGHGSSFDYWGFNKHEEAYHGNNYYIGEPSKTGSYLPKPSRGGYSSKPPYNNGGNNGHYLPNRPGFYDSYGHTSIQSIDNYENSILPAEPRFPSYDFLKDECSLRSATGFRLHKTVVKKYYLVPNIYECELQCFKEKDFPCSSYAYRYTTDAPTDNCYLSAKNYKELDYYTDVEPDRDFDIYTMNNIRRCQQAIPSGKDESECFWRVRSGQRLDHQVVRDSLSLKSIVDCQLECLNTVRFTCRAYSFRYGSPRIGGSVDNCLLTDWPFYELDPREHFVPEYGFETYERGSFGHGCEPDHFGIRGKHRKDSGIQIDQLCYVGFGSPARLLPQATKKSLRVETELECKSECSRAREGTLFQCMSFSYKSSNAHGGPNCMLSDILQTDLLPNIDYVPDPDSWLFAWDNFNPDCFLLAHDNHVHDDHRVETHNVLDTWRVYSVSGWPCKRGTKCKENIEAGFWFCEIEGGGHNSWDYCCHPDHQCGSSKGYPYQWCYVGPSKTQWRKCSDRYYPYIGNFNDRFDPPSTGTYLPAPIEPPFIKDHYVPLTPLHRPGVRPDRPPGIPTEPPPRPSLDEYENQFDDEFLSPPKPGGFGQPRHWPVSYLHKVMPPNATNPSNPKKMDMTLAAPANPKYQAIQDLINVIKTNDLNHVQYHISNESNKVDDILYVKIPLPTNFTRETTERTSKNVLSSNTRGNLEPVNVNEDVRTSRNIRRNQKSSPVLPPVSVKPETTTVKAETRRWFSKGIIERTNVTSHGRQSGHFRF